MLILNGDLVVSKSLFSFFLALVQRGNTESIVDKHEWRNKIQWETWDFNQPWTACQHQITNPTAKSREIRNGTNLSYCLPVRRKLQPIRMRINQGQLQQNESLLLLAHVSQQTQVESLANALTSAVVWQTLLLEQAVVISRLGIRWFDFESNAKIRSLTSEAMGETGRMDGDVAIVQLCSVEWHRLIFRPLFCHL